MTGDWGMSFVVGYGSKYPQRPHHQSSMCDCEHSIPCTDVQAVMDRPNPSVLKGALVGGPNKKDEYRGKQPPQL
jgi:hypothetical protein